MSNPLTSSDIAHLQTGTLDTSGYGEGTLRDVALVYRTETGQQPEQAAQEPEQPALFDADGTPTPAALPEADPDPGQEVGVQEPSEAAAADDAEDADTSAEDGGGGTAPVEPRASADKGGKAAAAAKSTPARRGKAG